MQRILPWSMQNGMTQLIHTQARLLFWHFFHMWQGRRFFVPPLIGDDGRTKDERCGGADGKSYIGNPGVAMLAEIGADAPPGAIDVEQCTILIFCECRLRPHVGFIQLCALFLVQEPLVRIRIRGKQWTGHGWTSYEENQDGQA